MWAQFLSLFALALSIEYQRLYNDTLLFSIYKTLPLSDPDMRETSDRVIQAAAGNPSAPTKILIIGDSMALGCGTKTPEAKLHRQIVDSYKDRAYVHTVGKFGAKLSDLPTLLEHAPKGTMFDTAIVFIGANDIAHLHLYHLTDKMRHVQYHLKQVSKDIWWGIGEPDMIPILTPQVRWMIGMVNKRAQKALSQRGLKPVKILPLMENIPTDPFAQHPDIYFAADGFHPSDVGYKYIFSKVDDLVLKPLLEKSEVATS